MLYLIKRKLTTTIQSILMITWVALGISNQSEKYYIRVVLRALSLIYTTFSNRGVFKKAFTEVCI